MTTAERFERARAYADEARERNRPECQCETCVQQRALPAVLRLLANWRQK